MKKLVLFYVCLFSGVITYCSEEQRPLIQKQNSDYIVIEMDDLKRNKTLKNYPFGTAKQVALKSNFKEGGLLRNIASLPVELRKEIFVNMLDNDEVVADAFLQIPSRIAFNLYHGAKDVVSKYGALENTSPVKFLKMSREDKQKILDIVKSSLFLRAASQGMVVVSDDEVENIKSLGVMNGQQVIVLHPVIYNACTWKGISVVPCAIFVASLLTIGTVAGAMYATYGLNYGDMELFGEILGSVTLFGCLVTVIGQYCNFRCASRVEQL